MRRALPAVLWLTGLGCAPPTQADADFQAFPAQPALQGHPAAPQRLTQATRRYRTELRRQSALGPNFNGHYRIAFWGCGTGCLEWAVVDLRNGATWRAPTEPCLVPRQDAAGELHWIDSRSDSSLLYLYDCQMTAATACPGDGELRRRAYTWTGRGVRLVEAGCVPAAVR